MKILVTGGAGYIGSILVPDLIKDGHEVVVVDKLTFGNNLKGVTGFKLYERDVLDIDPSWLEGMDAVVHLAGLSNDPMANFRPRDNFVYNNAVTALLVYLCKQKKVKRFIFGSTCSIYGYSAVKNMVESDPVCPSFPYGISKMQAEYCINSATDDSFRPIIFRQATVYGWAPRMRFDLVVNTMTKYGVRNGQITVNNPDLQRPLIHIKDLSKAYLLALRAPLDVVGTFNIARKNYTILEIAQEVHEALSNKGYENKLKINHEEDMRNYRVNIEKSEKIFGFNPQIDIKFAVDEILDKMGSKDNPDWENKWYINAEVYKAKVLAEEELWHQYLGDNHKGKIDFDWPEFWPQEGP